ncbi:MAG: hypothetical protein HYY18_23055 [Planctomycetes bacterium]|nr:hypothetical protein [Planctomycetota bacterium]
MTVRSILALSLLTVLAGCAAGPGPTEAAPAEFATVKDSYGTFRDALARDDYDGAYEALSRETRDRYPSQVFWIAFNMTSMGQRYRRLVATSVLVTSIEKRDGQSAVAILRAKDPGTGLYEMKSFRVVKEDGRWLVSFTLQEFFGIPEDEFFDLDKVAENRDFRHRR